jgi:hypothetical protein
LLHLETIDRSIGATANGEMTGRLRCCNDLNDAIALWVESLMQLVHPAAQIETSGAQAKETAAERSTK